MDETEDLIIGKIPGYNLNINPGLNKDLNYQERLKNNLTKIKLIPTGYKLNYAADAISAADKLANPVIAATEALNSTIGAITSTADTTVNILGEAVDGKFTTLKGLDALAAASIYTVGPNKPTGVVNSTSTAIQRWTSMVKATLDSLKSDDSNVNHKKTFDKSYNINALVILCTNDSTMTEVFGNEFGASVLDELTSKVASKEIFNLASKAAKLKNVISSSAGIEMLQAGTKLGENQLFNLISGKALGIQTALPKEWQRSTYANSLQLQIKLVSPSGHPDDIEEYILKPLMFIILAGSPVSSDGINFGYPTIFKVEAEGLSNIDLAGISAITITRGGNDTQFNRFNQPLNIDVRLVIEPLIESFSTITESSFGKDIEFKNMLVNNPSHIINSFNKTSNYKSLQL